ncbi:MAG: ribokinase, partial [Ruminococcaceae bacterium]|nr:ribokinase [Oscillospiraceae bacterium]
MKARVLVVGSANTDITATLPRFPRPGETVSGTSMAFHPGGKGNNQA